MAGEADAARAGRCLRPLPAAPPRTGAILDSMSPHDAGVVGEMLEAFNRHVPGVVVTFDEHCELDAPDETGRFGLG